MKETVYHCRYTMNGCSDWTWAVSAQSPAHAAQDFHFDRLQGPRLPYPDCSMAYFATVEVVGHGEYIARCFKHHLRRKGGVPVPGKTKTLQDIERELDLEEGALTEGEWELEEEEWK